MVGDLGALDKVGMEATKAAASLSTVIQEAVERWQPGEGYLAEGHWLDEVEEMARGSDLRVLRDGETLVSPPSVVRVDKNALRLNGAPRKSLRPSLLLQDLRTIAAKQPGGGKDFLESIYSAWQRRPRATALS